MQLEMTWLGAAGWLLRHRDHTVAIDPFFQRPPAARPHLPIRRDELPLLDYLLLTHGHFDHSADVPYLAATRARTTYVPRALLRDLDREWSRLPASRRRRERDWHGVDGGERLTIGDLEVSFHRIGTERFDLGMLRASLGKLLRGGDRRDWVTALRFLRTHIYGRCFAVLLHDRAAARKLVFFGNLTTNVDELARVHPDIDVAVLPYCPANGDWLAESIHVARALRPPVVLVHHFDQFLPPVTVGLDLPTYVRGVEDAVPGTTVHIPKFNRRFAFASLLDPVTGQAPAARAR
jgi:L-ascorbate metabolism protein UlaG (beta-lactamase superfamily)